MQIFFQSVGGLKWKSDGNAASKSKIYGDSSAREGGRERGDSSSPSSRHADRQSGQIDLDLDGASFELVRSSRIDECRADRVIGHCRFDISLG